MKIIRSRDLIRANQKAVEAGLEAILPNFTMKALDPFGINVLDQLCLVSDDKGVRVRGFLKLRGEKEPKIMSFDLRLEDFNELKDAPKPK